MTTYTANFRTDAEWAEEEFEAETPQQALALARAFYDSHTEDLMFQSYDGGMPVNEIEISGDAGDKLVVWRDEYLTLHLAASDLLDALEQAVAALNTARRFPVPSLLSDSYKIAAICDQAIAKAKPPKS
jgi:stage V sporulation protein SpoVS